MLIIMNSDATEDQVDHLFKKFEKRDSRITECRVREKWQLVLLETGDYDQTKSHLEILPGVFKIMRITKS